MDDPFPKHNTDCVYFLASPLTCKKGIECEYRHSEIARLNPRECWYWLSGSCFNTACAFRHPPLDGNTGAIPESAPNTVAVVKTNAPCYYFVNGYCNKGEKCSFLHGIDPDAQPEKKPVKTALKNSEALCVENNTNGNSNFNSSATTKVESDTKSPPKEDLYAPVVKDASPQSSSPKISVSDDDETATIRSDSYVPELAFERTGAYACEDYVDDEGELEREERWESSPGFDVLVDGESENDGEYFPEVYRRRTELDDRFAPYDFENEDVYNPSYPEMEFHRENDVLYRSDPYVRDSFSDHARVEMFDPIIFRESNHHSGTDLRDKLTRRRFIEDRSYSHSSRRHESDALIRRIQEHPPHHQHKRPAPEFRRYVFEPSVREEIMRKNERPFPKSRTRRQYKETRPTKMPRLFSEVSRKTVPRSDRSEGRSNRDSGAFSGPKTLTQIREEKRRSDGENGNSILESGRFDRMMAKDFDGPKPLSEILKEKRKAGL